MCQVCNFHRTSIGRTSGLLPMNLRGRVIITMVVENRVVIINSCGRLVHICLCVYAFRNNPRTEICIKLNRISIALMVGAQPNDKLIFSHKICFNTFYSRLIVKKLKPLNKKPKSYLIIYKLILMNIIIG